MPPLIWRFVPPYGPELNFPTPDSESISASREKLKRILMEEGADAAAELQMQLMQSVYTYSESVVTIVLDSPGMLHLEVAMRKAAKDIPAFLDSINEDFNNVKSIVVTFPVVEVGKLWGIPIVVPKNMGQ